MGDSGVRRIVVGVSGASGMPYAVALLEALGRADGVESHLVVSPSARAVLVRETGSDPDILRRLADREHDAGDFAAPPSSGSWRHDGMVVCPCSMSTLAAIAAGTGTNLLHRAADVTLKERRPLILAVRETPLSTVHLRNMLTAAEAGATIMPPVPAFYSRPESLRDIVAHFVGRVLDHLAVPHSLVRRWGE